MAELTKHLKKSGLLVLDAHLNPLDILLTAKYFHKTCQATLTMPIAGYALHVPFMKQVVTWFAKSYQIKFLPVYRKEELAPTNLLMRFLCLFYPSNTNEATRQQANQFFIATASQACQKVGQVVVVAPYGSPLWFGRSIKNGVKQIMFSRAAFVVSRTKWTWKKMKFTTQLGKINCIDKITTDQTLQNLVKKEFEVLL